MLSRKAISGLEQKKTLAFLLVLSISLSWAAPAAGSLEKIDKSRVNWPGTVYLYHPDSDRPASTPEAELLDDRMPRRDWFRSLSSNSSRLDRPGSLGQKADSKRIKVLSRTLDEGGIALDLLCHGNHCYVATTGCLQVYDIADPSAPVMVNEIEGPAWSLACSGSLLAVCMGIPSEVVLFDISDPVNPLELSRTAAPPGEFIYEKVAMTGTLMAVIGSGWFEYFGPCDFMSVIDIADPASPEVTSSLVGVDEDFWAVVTEGSYIYLSIYHEGLATFDVSNLEEIVQSGLASLEYTIVDDMDFHDGYLYLAGDGMVVMDAADPGNPVEIAQVGGDYTGGVIASNGYAYVTDDNDYSLHTYDIVDPANPVLLNKLDAFGFHTYLDLAGTTVFLVDRVFGMIAVDVSDPLSPVSISFTSTGYYPHATDVENNVATVLSNEATLQTLDVSDPRAPELLGSCTQPPDTTTHNTYRQRGVRVSDGIAVVGSHNDGVNFYDVSIPSSPHQVGTMSYNYAWGAYPAERVGDLVYVGATEVEVLDITDPANPVQVGTGPALQQGPAYDLIIDGDRGYMHSYNEVVIFDLTDPVAPVELSRFDVDRLAMAFALDGNILGVSGYDWGTTTLWDDYLIFYDVSDPLNPTEVGKLESPEVTSAAWYDVSLAAKDGFFYICGYDQFMVIDATDPVNAFVVAVYPETTEGWHVGGQQYAYNGVTLADGLIYLTGHLGLEILRFVDVSVTLDPGPDPIVVPLGGSFTYDVTVENVTEETQTKQVWIDLTLPAGTSYGPVTGPVTLTLPPGMSIENTLPLRIPGAAPLGMYTLHARVGTYPDDVSDDDRFEFQVTP